MKFSLREWVAPRWSSLRHYIPRSGQTEFEILRLVFLTSLALLLVRITGYEPRLRFTLRNLATGLAFGPAVGALSVVVHFLMKRYLPPRCTRGVTRSHCARSRYSLIAKAIVSGAGEELLLRGCIFGTFLIRKEQPLAAHAANFLGSALLQGQFRRNEFLIPAIRKGIEGGALALLFQATGSLAAVAAARMTAEILLSSSLFCNILSNKKKGTPRDEDSHTIP